MFPAEKNLTLLVELDQQMDYRHHRITHASILNMMWYDGRDLKLVLFKHTRFHRHTTELISASSSK